MLRCTDRNTSKLVRWQWHHHKEFTWAKTTSGQQIDSELHLYHWTVCGSIEAQNSKSPCSEMFEGNAKIKGGKTNQLKFRVRLTLRISKPFIIFCLKPMVWGYPLSPHLWSEVILYHPHFSGRDVIQHSSRLLIRSEVIHDHWREHFNELLNQPSNVYWTTRSVPC